MALVLALPLVFDSGALDMFRGPKSELALACWGVLAAVFVVGNLGGGAWRDRWWAPWAGVLAGGAVSALACPEPARALANLVPAGARGAGVGRGPPALGGPAPLARAPRGLGRGGRGRARPPLLAAVVAARGLRLFGALAGRYAWIGTLGNPADVATFLVLPALLAAQRAIAARRRRLAWTVAAVLLAGVVLGTRTITGALALAAGALVIAWRATSRRWRLPVVAGVLRRRCWSSSDAARRAGARGGLGGPSGGLIWLGSGRAAAFAAAGSMLAARPLTGVGFGLFEANSFRFQSPDTLADRGRVLGLVTGFGEAHNDLLQYAAETGLVGVALAAAGAALALRRGRAGGAGLLDPVPLAAAALVVVLAEFPLHLAANAAQWAVLAALALPPLPPPPTTAAVAGAGAAAGGRAPRRGRARGGVAAVPRRHGVRAGQGAGGHAARGAGALAGQDRAGARRACQPPARAFWRPYSWEADVILGNVAFEAGETRAALASFGRALALADRPEIRFDVGMALLVAGNEEAGMARLEQAVKLNPAVFRAITDPKLARALRRRLDASGYGAKHAWMYEGTPAATP